MIARILAVVAAVGLVAGAIVLRGAIADDDAGPGDNASPGLIWCDPLGVDACIAAADGAEVEQTEPGKALAWLSDPEAEIPTFGLPTLVASTPSWLRPRG